MELVEQEAPVGLSASVAGDSDGNLVITVNELVGAVARALNTCSPP